MAIISSYPTIVPLLGDKVLGSNTVDSTGTAVVGNPTVQYDLSAIKTLVDQIYSQKLSSFNAGAITPGWNNVGIPIIFGAADETDPSVHIDAAGKVTFKATGSYSIQQIYYGQGTNPTNIILNFKTVQDGVTQIGPTTTSRFIPSATNTRLLIEINSVVNIVSSDTYYNFWIQNPTTGGAGGLATQVTDAAWATDVPSAQIIITKLV
jgi:hypothetical protein|tara:strand:+ start:144 stop:764 length:621 start_codon:yes stop_codon:yes gene_type:complete